MTQIYNMCDREYHADPAIGSTTAKLALDSMQLFADDINGIRKAKDSKAFQFGRAAHARITNPGLFATMISAGPINQKTGKPYGTDSNVFAEWQAANPGAVVLSQRDLEDLERMMARMPAEVAAVFAKPGVAESSMFREIAGVKVKARPDWLTEGAIWDIKTIANIADAEKHISKFKYWFSHAWYRMIVKEEIGRAMPFRFVFCEKNPPYRWRIIDIDADWIGYADATVDRVLGEISEAQRTGDYADRGSVCLTVSQPAWSDDAEFTDGDEGISL
jgi:hypothetical protein